MAKEKFVRLTGKPYFLLWKVLMSNDEWRDRDLIISTFGISPEGLRRYIRSKMVDDMTLDNMKADGWAVHQIDRYFEPKPTHCANLSPRWIGASSWRNKYIDNLPQ